MDSRSQLIDQLISTVKVRISKDIAMLRVGGRDLGEIRQGSLMTLPLWVAEILWQEQLADPVGGGVDFPRLVQLTWRERKSPVELVELPEKFYYGAASQLTRLREVDAGAYKSFMEGYRDLVYLRLKKILEFAPQRLDPVLIKNMTDEERELYVRVRAEVESWLASVGLGVR
ncbi:MAG: hypothetical protein QXO86_03665 [Nitrososphaerota archaeon]